MNSVSDWLQFVFTLVLAGDVLATLSMRGKITSMQADLKVAMKTQADQAISLALLSDRLARIDGTVSAWSVWREDITGFLQGLGFKKRDG